MKEKLINFKNKIMTFVSKNKIASIAIITALVVICIIIAIICNKTKKECTSGNLNNLGFSVSDNNWIYYLGYNEGEVDGIYKIKSNGTKKEKITDDYGYYINESGNYLYYLDSEGKDIIKLNKSKNDKEILVEDVDIFKITVEDNWIYYFKNSALFRVKTNGENKQQISTKTMENYDIVDDWIYYSYYNDGKYIIAKMKTNGDDISKINTEAGKEFFVYKDYIYYIHETYNEENTETSYELYKMKANGKNVKELAQINGKIDIDTINFDGHQIYYTKTDDNGKLAIYKMKTNGEETKVVDINGYSTLINVHENYIYYPDESDNGSIEINRVNINGKDKQSI